MNAALEVDENVFVVDVLNVGNKADTMDVSSLEAVAVLAISPAIASPSATDTSNSSDGDHRDQGRDETTTSVATIPAS